MRKPLTKGFVALFSSWMLLNSNETHGWMVALKSDLGVLDGIRRCLYSDGKVYTFSQTELCPTGINIPPPNFDLQQGLFVEEQSNGLTKLCIYDLGGHKGAIRINATTLCPLSHKFE
jgi:hypothetical protein